MNQHNQQRTPHFEKNRYRPNVQYHQNRNVQLTPNHQTASEPMEVDTTDRNVRQPTQFQRNNDQRRYNNPFRSQQPFKRGYNGSNNHFNQHKQQRINNTVEEDDVTSMQGEYEDEYKSAFLD